MQLILSEEQGMRYCEENLLGHELRRKTFVFFTEDYVLAVARTTGLPVVGPRGTIHCVIVGIMGTIA